ncbi:methyltransferase [Bradyrhizobium sp. GCM10027634]|uniref:methyltransferase n=1 Tax=unclassified Bradyrhizobium TaxID=2631580 RepID=UPI00188B0EA0|nr:MULTISPECIES: methyltransferase [unclassified Bradyrhizobium]MDN5005231.1 methyltransferase [Bradyrhizobium sp. WYCCWR 12677]
MPAQSPAVELMKLIGGFQVSQAISAMAELGIADVLKGDVLASNDIARAVKCDPPSLYRLLHALASAGLLEEQADQRFRLTPVGECLRSDFPDSRSAWARYVGRPYVRQSWGNLADCVRSGKSAFELLHQANLWTWRGERPEETAIFDAAMSELSRSGGAAIASAHDFSAYKVIVDIGGGQGALLAAILSHHRDTRGILFDLPHVIAKAQDLLAAAKVDDRCEIVGGDVFKSVPGGGDAYVIKSVLMDESDDSVVSILRRCRSVMTPSARIIVIEHLLTPPNQPEVNYSDMTMMVMTGGRERTQREFEALFAASGLRLEQAVATRSPFTLLIGTQA